MKVDPGHYKVVLDNANVRVLRVDLLDRRQDTDAPASRDAGDSAGVLDSAASPRRMASRKTSTSPANRPRLMPAGLAQPARTSARGAPRAIVIEFKAAAPGKAALPASRPSARP